MAGSYQAQARRDLAEALNMAKSAAAKSPGFGFAQERLAEMEFSFGQTEPALAALKKSLALSPRNAQALALKGFALSAQNKIAQAGLYFDQAIAADGSLANGWLGRGLVRIRSGHVERRPERFGNRRRFGTEPRLSAQLPGQGLEHGPTASGIRGTPIWPPTNSAWPCAWIRTTRRPGFTRPC